jgi:hypothetical protein
MNGAFYLRFNGLDRIQSSRGTFLGWFLSTEFSYAKAAHGRHRGRFSGER